MFEESDYTAPPPPKVVSEGKWRHFAAGCLSSVIPGAGHFLLRELRRRAYVWAGAFVLCLLGTLLLEPWRTPDGRMTAFIAGAVLLCAAGIDAAFADTEEDLRATSGRSCCWPAWPAAQVSVLTRPYGGWAGIECTRFHRMTWNPLCYKRNLLSLIRERIAIRLRTAEMWSSPPWTAMLVRT